MICGDSGGRTTGWIFWLVGRLFGLDLEDCLVDVDCG